MSVAACETATVLFGNVPLTTVTAFKFHDGNMTGLHEPAAEPYSDTDGSGFWTPSEPYTDLDCDGEWDDDEYFEDTNGNGVYDPAEPFTDVDGDGRYDYAECPIPTWPFQLGGNRADGLPICPDIQTTGSDGRTTFVDLPPSDDVGYTLSEALDWCSVNVGWAEPVMRATHHVGEICTGFGLCGEVDRWQATTDIDQTFVLECSEDHSEDFGNVCLARLDGIKEVYDNGMPGQAPPTPGEGWQICLAGTDVLGRDVVASGVECSALPEAADEPIDLPCLDPVWYETVTDSDGKFAFVDLLPGHYHLAEQPDPNYRLTMSRPMLSGFDVMCCPQEVTLRNIRKDLAWKVYQAYEGDSNLNSGYFAGLGGLMGDPITAVPGVLKIVPGANWSNYTQASVVCRESYLKSTLLRKEFDGFLQCSDVFTPFSPRAARDAEREAVVASDV